MNVQKIITFVVVLVVLSGSRAVVACDEPSEKSFSGSLVSKLFRLDPNACDGRSIDAGVKTLDLNYSREKVADIDYRNEKREMSPSVSRADGWLSDELVSRSVDELNSSYSVNDERAPLIQSLPGYQSINAGHGSLGRNSNEL